MPDASRSKTSSNRRPSQNAHEHSFPVDRSGSLLTPKKGVSRATLCRDTHSSAVPSPPTDTIKSSESGLPGGAPCADGAVRACTTRVRAPALSRVVVLGDRRPFCVAVVTLQQEGATGEDAGTGALAGLARLVSPDLATTDQAVQDAAWHAYVLKAIEGANADPVACPSHAARIRKFTILRRDLSMARDEITPTFKVKRHGVEAACAKVLAEMYESAASQEIFGDAVAYVREP